MNLVLIFSSLCSDTRMCVSPCVKYSLNELSVEDKLLYVILGHSMSK